MELALRCVPINLSAVFLTESFFFPLSPWFKACVCVCYLYGNLLVNYSPSLTVVEDFKRGKEAAGCIQAI